MSYAYGQVDVNLGAITATGTGDKAYWNPGYIPWWVRACSLTVTTLETTTATVINFTTQAIPKSNSGISAGDIAILKDPKLAVGTVIYKDNIKDKAIVPGADVVLNVGTAGSTAVYWGNMIIEPNYEIPANNTSMVVTT